MGPYATQILGDMGADIVKVESPEGDTTRQAGYAKHPGMGAVFLTIARNKRSIVLDLKRSAAREALFALARGPHVLLHNMRPDATRRLGLDYDALRAANPSIVYCAARGFASDARTARSPRTTT